MKIYCQKYDKSKKVIYSIVGNNDNMKKDSQSNISQPRSRNLYLDVVKGIAIILVVFGHNIQYGSFECNNGDFFENPLFIAIYSFHMPLFMLISGYLFYHTIKSHSWGQNVKSRFTKLVLPIIIWNSIYLLIMDAHIIWGGASHWLSACYLFTLNLVLVGYLLV